jgi:hypothetical protein
LDCRHVCNTCAFHDALQVEKQKEVHPPYSPNLAPAGARLGEYGGRTSRPLLYRCKLMKRRNLVPTIFIVLYCIVLYCIFVVSYSGFYNQPDDGYVCIAETWSCFICNIKLCILWSCILSLYRHWY